MKEKDARFENIKKCPVCASSSLSSFKKRTFDYLDLSKDQVKITDSEYGKIWDLSRCGNCTHVFANPCPTPAFIHSLYSEVADPIYEEEAQGRAKNFIRILSFLGKLYPNKEILFDVGAATGILLHLARQRGWKSEGIETSTWAVKVAAEKYNLNLLEGSFESHPLKPNHYTAVTMVDFIEHIPRPFDAVRKAFEILAPGGTLCVVTPDINSMATKITGLKWWHFRPGHLGYFSLKSLSFLLDRGGFRIKKRRKYSWTFSAHYLLSRKRGLKFLLKDPDLTSFWKKIPIKLALGDSFEIYATKVKRT